MRIALAAAGIILGMAGSAALIRLLKGVLCGVTPTDPPTYAAVTGVLLGVAALTSWIPARRAAAVDPAEALRSE